MVKRINVANGTLEVSEISLGCMRIADLSPKEAEVHIHSALEVGIDFLTMQIFMPAAKRRKYSVTYWLQIPACATG